MAEKIQTITLQNGDEARLAPAGTGNDEYVIQRWRTTMDQHGRPRVKADPKGLFSTGQKDALGASIPVTLDADTTLVVKGAPPPDNTFAFISSDRNPLVTGGDPTTDVDITNLSKGRVFMSRRDLSHAAPSLNVRASGPVHININDAMAGLNTREINVGGGPLVVRMDAATLQKAEINVSGNTTEIIYEGRRLISKGPVEVDVVSKDNKVAYRASAGDLAGHLRESHQQRADAISAALNSDKPRILSIPDNLSVDGFRPRIRFETDVMTRDGEYTVAAGSKIRPRVEQISQVVSLEENGNDKNQLKDDRFPPGAWLLTVKTGGRTRTYGIEQGAPGIEINAPEHGLSVTIDRTNNKSIEENRQNLRPLMQPKKAPAQQKAGGPELSDKTRMAVQEKLDLSIALLGQVSGQVRPGSRKGSFNDDRLVEILAPVKKAADALFEGANTALNKETRDIKPLREALEIATTKLEKLKEEGGVAGAVLDKLNKVKKHLDNVDTMRNEDKAGRPQKPNGVSQVTLDQAVAAVSLPADMSKLGIGINPATQLSSIPHLGGTTIQKS